MTARVPGVHSPNTHLPSPILYLRGPGSSTKQTESSVTATMLGKQGLRGNCQRAPGRRGAKRWRKDEKTKGQSGNPQGLVGS